MIGPRDYCQEKKKDMLFLIADPQCVLESYSLCLRRGLTSGLSDGRASKHILYSLDKEHVYCTMISTYKTFLCFCFASFFVFCFLGMCGNEATWKSVSAWCLAHSRCSRPRALFAIEDVFAKIVRSEGRKQARGLE